MTDDHLRERLGRAGRETIHSDFTNTVHADRFMKHLRAEDVEPLVFHDTL